MAGIFATAQPQYAALGIATFPFDATEEIKRGPLVKRFGSMGLPASRQMALRFADAPGLAALAGARNRFTVIDIDERGAAGERLLADTQRQYGPAKVIVRTGSGGFHGYYRHNGEQRKIRPDPSKPIDLIGEGPVVLPPTRGFRGNYEIIHGRIEDLARLAPIKGKSSAVLAEIDDPRSARVGERDKKFWPYIARHAHTVKSFDELQDHAREINSMMASPLSDAEVAAKCLYWWDKTQKRENRFGIGRDVRFSHKLIDHIAMRDPDGYALLSFVRRHHWGRDFYLANATHASVGWTLKRFVAARSRLIEGGYLIVVKPAVKHLKLSMTFRLSEIAHL